MSRRRQSQSWLKQHKRDEFVRAAQSSGARSRALYKLEQIDRRDRLIRPGLNVVDMGAAPGGWSEYVARKLKGRGRVVAVDRLPIDPIAGVQILETDLMSDAVADAIIEALDGQRADLVLSDAAPNVSGIRDADTAESVALCERILELARVLLKPGGGLVLKIFEGAGVQEFEKELAACFTECRRRKPAASRDRSREIYLLARNFRMV